MVKTIGCIIARTVSTRLPKKVLKKIKDRMLIEHIIQKMKRAKNIDLLYLCTSIDPEDKILLDIATTNGIKSYAGSREIVIDRMLNVAEIENADTLVRITGDNIFCDEIFTEKLIDLHHKYKSDYSRVKSLPIGVTTEIFSVKGLKNLYNELDPKQTEYLTYYVFYGENNLKKLISHPPKKLQKPFYSLTIDTPEDFERTLFIFNHLNYQKGIFLDEIFDLNEKNPIPSFKIDKEMLIKFPNNMKIKYSQYLKKLEEKYNNCINIELEEDFYEKNKNR
ncbi:MAG: cytidylyltransferase domain-containing protein [Promethearchaeota archaeon]